MFKKYQKTEFKCVMKNEFLKMPISLLYNGIKKNPDQNDIDNKKFSIAELKANRIKKLVNQKYVEHFTPIVISQDEIVDLFCKKPFYQLATDGEIKKLVQNHGKLTISEFNNINKKDIFYLSFANHAYYDNNGQALPTVLEIPGETGIYQDSYKEWDKVVDLISKSKYVKSFRERDMANYATENYGSRCVDINVYIPITDKRYKKFYQSNTPSNFYVSYNENYKQNILGINKYRI